MNQKINMYRKFLVLASFLLPAVSYAQLGGTIELFRQFDVILSVYLIPIAFSTALLFFFWGAAQYVRSAGSEKEEGRKILVWGVVALFVMSSIWGLVAFIRKDLLGTTSGNDTIKIPKIER